MFRKLCFCLVLALTASVSFADQPSPVSIMSQNLDAGTDLGFAFAELLGDFPPGVGVELTYQEVLASAIPARMSLLAAKMAAKKPDILAVVEVALWRTGPANNATQVIADELGLLVSDLASRGVPYDVVAVNTVADAALPKASGGVLRYTDRNVLLVRSDLRPPAFNISDVHSNVFDAVLNFGGLQAPNGWISAMVHLGNRHFRLAVTHLSSPVPGDPAATAIQVQQAQQLLNELRNSAVPVVIAGDFNSDAILGTAGPGPDNTPTAALIQSAGYVDTWAAAGSGTGPTWPFFLEDQFPPPFVIPSTPFERIDLIFSQGLSVVNVEHVIAPGPTANQFPTFGSDHAGVLATFQF